MVFSLVFHWLHLLGIIIWVGGLAFNLFALRVGLPLLSVSQRSRFVHKVMGRFLHIVWGSIVIVTGTGLYRVFFVNRMTNLEAFLLSSYGHSLTTKIVLVLGMIVIASIITFSTYRRLSSHLQDHVVETEPPKTCPQCGNLLTQSRRLMTVGLILAGIVILLAAILRGA